MFLPNELERALLLAIDSSMGKPFRLTSKRRLDTANS